MLDCELLFPLRQIVSDYLPTKRKPPPTNHVPVSVARFMNIRVFVLLMRADVWDESFDGKFVSFRDKGRSAVFATSNSGFLGICGKYSLGSPQVDTTWSVHFEVGELKQVAIGLVRRSLHGDEFLLRHGDVDCSHTIWQQIQLERPAVRSLEASISRWITEIQINDIKLPDLGVGHGDLITLEFQFSKTKEEEKVHLIKLNGHSIQQVMFSGPVGSLNHFHPYFGVFHPKAPTVHIR